MGCGCGKKVVQRTGTVKTVTTVSGSDKVQTAQVYQSATTKTAPQTPVRQTV